MWYLCPIKENNMLKCYFLIRPLLPLRMATYPKNPPVINTTQRWPRLRVKVNTSIPISVRRYMAKTVCLGSNGVQMSIITWEKRTSRMTRWDIKPTICNITKLSLTLKSHLVVTFDYFYIFGMLKEAYGIFHTETLSLEVFGLVQPNATQERSHNPSKD